MGVWFVVYSVQTVLEVEVEETGEGDDVSGSCLKRVGAIERWGRNTESEATRNSLFSCTIIWVLAKAHF